MSDTFDPKYFEDLLISDKLSNLIVKQISSYMWLQREHNSAIVFNYLKEKCLLSNNFLLFFNVMNELICMCSIKMKYEYLFLCGDILSDLIDNLTLKCEDNLTLLKVYEIIQIWDILLIFSTELTTKVKKKIMDKVS